MKFASTLCKTVDDRRRRRQAPRTASRPPASPPALGRLGSPSRIATVARQSPHRARRRCRSTRRRTARRHPVIGLEPPERSLGVPFRGRQARATVGRVVAGLSVYAASSNEAQARNTDRPEEAAVRQVWRAGGRCLWPAHTHRCCRHWICVSKPACPVAPASRRHPGNPDRVSGRTGRYSGAPPWQYR